MTAAPVFMDRVSFPGAEQHVFPPARSSVSLPPTLEIKWSSVLSGQRHL